MVRLWKEDLVRVYPVLFAYLVFDALRSFAGMLFPARSQRQVILYLATEPVVWLLYFLLVREIYRIALRDLHGVRTFGLSAQRWILAAAGAISLAMAASNFNSDQMLRSGLYAAGLFGRISVTTAAILLFGLALIMAVFPVSLSVNARALLTGYTFYFVAKACGLGLVGMLGRSVGSIVVAGTLAVQTLVLVYWLAALRQHNERRSGPMRAPSNPQEAEILLARIGQINATLEKVSHK